MLLLIIYTFIYQINLALDGFSTTYVEFGIWPIPVNTFLDNPFEYKVIN